MYINFKYLKMPMTIGLMFLSIVLSFLIMITGWFDNNLVIIFENIFNQIDFNQTLMGGMLSFLLFAGALHVDINDLNKQKDIISILATIGVVFTTFFGFLLSTSGEQIWHIFIGPSGTISILAFYSVLERSRKKEINHA